MSAGRRYVVHGIPVTHGQVDERKTKNQLQNRRPPAVGPDQVQRRTAAARCCRHAVPTDHGDARSQVLSHATSPPGQRPIPVRQPSCRRVFHAAAGRCHVVVVMQCRPAADERGVRRLESADLVICRYRPRRRLTRLL